MWFTRVSIANPVMAVMVMLAFVVLGLFSLPAPEGRPVPRTSTSRPWWCTVDYPGAAPEIVESRGHEEDRGSGQHHRRHQPAVLAQLRRQLGGHRPVQPRHGRPQGRRRRAREGLADPPAAARRGQGPRVSRFDPASQPIFNAGRHLARRQQVSPQELTTFADQVLQEAAGERARRGLGQPGRRRQARDQRLPEARRAGSLGRGRRAGDAAAVRSENQELPAGALRSARTASAWCRSTAAEAHRPRLRDMIVARRGGAAGQAWAGGRRGRRPAGSGEPGAVQRPSACWRWTCRRARARTPSRWSTACCVWPNSKPQLPPGMKLEVVRDNSRPSACRWPTCSARCSKARC
jgi:HAE1 family hydrophobic/amphiphilic exporter-1